MANAWCGERHGRYAWSRRVGPPWRRREEYRCAYCDDPVSAVPPRLLLGDGDLDKLAAYNAERARGIVHTPEWDERMARAQTEFDQLSRAFRGQP